MLNHVCKIVRRINAKPFFRLITNMPNFIIAINPFSVHILLVTIALTLFTSVSASRLITSHFSFKHVGTGISTSVYKVSLILYSDVTGVAMPSTVATFYEKLGPNGTIAAP